MKNIRKGPQPGIYRRCRRLSTLLSRWQRDACVAPCSAGGCVSRSGGDERSPGDEHSPHQRRLRGWPQLLVSHLRGVRARRCRRHLRRPRQEPGSGDKRGEQRVEQWRDRTDTPHRRPPATLRSRQLSAPRGVRAERPRRRGLTRSLGGAGARSAYGCRGRAASMSPRARLALL